MDKIILPTGFLPMLTVKQIEAAKPKEKPYRLLDGNGLYLYVPVSGKKVWQLRYKIDGKEKY
ncbi:Arm DNA-binding domain-containing protein [Escherichia coli]|nr:Arm DNA-binding domain-containing protein [Escherichia coli]